MFYSDDLIEEVRERNDITDVIGGYVRLRRKGAYYFGLCPFHNEKTPSFSVSPSKQIFHCFGCGEGGNVITFLMKYENYSFTEAVEELAKRAGISLPEVKYSKEEQRRADIKNGIFEANREAASYYHQQLKTGQGREAYQYLRDRKLSDSTIKKFGLGYAGSDRDGLYLYLKDKGYKDEVLKETGLFTYSEKGVSDKFFRRVMFPIMDERNRVVAFGGRVTGDGAPKYLNSPETKVFDKSRTLYGIHAARNYRGGTFLICEGYMDVIALHQAGFTNAVAALGTSFTPGHAVIIKRYAKEAVLTFDSDEAGIKAALRAIPVLRNSGLSVRVLNLKPHKDPDEFIKAKGNKAYQERIDRAVNFFIYQLDAERGRFDLSDPQQKTAFHNRVAQMLLSFDDELERMNYLDSACGIYNIPKDALTSLVKKKALTYKGSKDEYNYPAPSRARVKREDGLKKAQKIILSELSEHPAMFERIRDVISPDDFDDPLICKVAKIAWEQLEDGYLNPAAIIDRLELEEEHKAAADLFQSALSDELSFEEREKAVNDVVLLIKKNSLNRKMDSAGDIASMQRLMAEQKKLQSLHVSLR